MSKHIVCVVGTRPEAVKMAPIILELKRRPEEFSVTVMATGQHREMLDQVMQIFEIVPDVDLNVMKLNQTLSDVTCAILSQLVDWLKNNPTDVLLAQGDTTTVMAAAVACFYTQVSFGHVEAGLRTHNLYSPFPEEFNRRVAGLVSSYHFAPTALSAGNLLREGTEADDVYTTGNSVIDASLYVQSKTTSPEKPFEDGRPYVLMTCHRRENHGDPIKRIFNAVREFAERHPDIQIWYPVHPTPNIKGPAHEMLGTISNVSLTEPLNYIAFTHAMAGAEFLLSDSGGVQEEAPSMGKPVLVLRENTERPEGVDSGTCLLVGSDTQNILDHLEKLASKSDLYTQMSEAVNPYGDGLTSKRIADVLATGQCSDWTAS